MKFTLSVSEPPDYWQKDFECPIGSKWAVVDTTRQRVYFYKKYGAALKKYYSIHPPGRIVNVFVPDEEPRSLALFSPRLPK